jgi:hypothetical protein
MLIIWSTDVWKSVSLMAGAVFFYEKSANALHKPYSEPFLGDPKPYSKHKMHCSHILLERYVGKEAGL